MISFVSFLLPRDSRVSQITILASLGYKRNQGFPLPDYTLLPSQDVFGSTFHSALRFAGLILQTAAYSS
jgi:hypothetical protein